MLWLLFFACLIFGIPKMETLLRPNTVSKIETMLNHSGFQKCTVTVNREDVASILITVAPNRGSSINTELYKYFMSDLSQAQNETILFAHTINQHPNGSFYLTQTQIWADAELTRARRIEVEYCDLMKDPDGRVTYEGHVPVYECAVPIKRASCLAKDTENHAQ